MMKPRFSVSKPKPDSDLLQGTWSVAALEMDGQKSPDAMLAGAHIVLKGDRFQSLGMGAVYEGKLVLDPAASPKTFDLKFTKGPEKGNTSFGIYELTGEEWKICMTTRVGATASDRPRKFATKPGTGVVLEILKRGKAQPAPKRSNAKRPRGTSSKGAGALTGEATELEGEWSLVSGSLDDKAMDAMTVSYGVRSFQGDHTTLKFGPQTMIDATFSLDPSKSPCEIDYAHSKGMFAGKQQLGIYECDGKTLNLCASTPGTPRPKDFKPGAGRNVTTFRKR
jgi:uncharacterized protein (TIGR03067 family)